MRANRRLAQLWLDALATELGAAAGTIETYTDDLNCYLTWLEGQNLGLQGVTLERVRDYIRISISAVMPGRPWLDASPSCEVFIAS
jgi:site-specific recombinase XerD